MAGDAARIDDLLYLREGHCGASRFGFWRDEPRDGGDGDDAGDPHPRRRAALVPHHEPDADQRAGERHADQHQPAPAMAEGHRVVVGDHHEDHGQREVRVVDTPLLAHRRVLRVGLAAFAHRQHHAPLPRNDHVQHVRAHDRAENRAVVDERATAAEEFRQPPCRRRQQHEKHQRQHALVHS